MRPKSQIIAFFRKNLFHSALNEILFFARGENIILETKLDKSLKTSGYKAHKCTKETKIQSFNTESGLETESTRDTTSDTSRLSFA